MANRLSLLEVANRIQPNGEAARIAEIMTHVNEILEDMPWTEANGTTTHKVTQRTSLPTGAWRAYNEGVNVEKSTTRQVNEPIGMLESYSECDKALCDISPDPVQFRMSEAASFLEGMSQTLSRSVIYGDHASSPKEPNGILPRYNSLAPILGKNLVQSCGGTGSVTSVYVIQWGVDKVFAVYPRNSANAGIQHQDLGEWTLYDANNKPFQGYRDHFVVNMGLVVKNPLCVGRVCNIATSGTSNLFDEDVLINVLNQMWQGGKGNTVIYVNRTVKTQMEIALLDRANVWFSVQNGLGGVPVLTFRGIPVHLVDEISDTESVVS